MPHWLNYWKFWPRGHPSHILASGKIFAFDIDPLGRPKVTQKSNQLIYILSITTSYQSLLSNPSLHTPLTCLNWYEKNFNFKFFIVLTIWARRFDICNHLKSIFTNFTLFGPVYLGQCLKVSHAFFLVRFNSSIAAGGLYWREVIFSTSGLPVNIFGIQRPPKWGPDICEHIFFVKWPSRRTKSVSKVVTREKNEFRHAGGNPPSANSVDLSVPRWLILCRRHGQISLSLLQSLLQG